MGPLPVPILAASRDPELQPRDLHVLVNAWAELDLIEVRPLKQTWLARRCALTPSTVNRAVKRLCARGYLAQGAVEGDRRRKGYRLMASPKPVSPVAAVKLAV